MALVGSIAQSWPSLYRASEFVSVEQAGASHHDVDVVLKACRLRGDQDISKRDPRANRGKKSEFEVIAQFVASFLRLGHFGMGADEPRPGDPQGSIRRAWTFHHAAVGTECSVARLLPMDRLGSAAQPQPPAPSPQAGRSNSRALGVYRER